MTTRLIMGLHSGRGHEWVKPNNSVLGEECSICHVKARWAKLPGVPRQILQNGAWVTVPRDPQCLPLARWSRATV